LARHAAAWCVRLQSLLRSGPWAYPQPATAVLKVQVGSIYIADNRRENIKSKK